MSQESRTSEIARLMQQYQTCLDEYFRYVEEAVASSAPLITPHPSFLRAQEYAIALDLLREQKRKEWEEACKEHASRPTPSLMQQAA